MVDQIDFGELYDRLGMTPACSLREFQLAYRRRVAALHPDRGHGNFAQLQRLNILYTAAMAFHRHSGRLPGARPVHDPEHRPATIRWTRMTATNEREPATRRRHPWLLAFMLLVLSCLAFLYREPGPPPPPSSVIPAGERDIHPATNSNIPRFIGLGMEPAMVAAIEGEPVRNTGTQWQYGPSWIEFRCGVVDDWYSSPLRSLHVRSTRPDAETGHAPEDCSRLGVRLR